MSLNTIVNVQIDRQTRFPTQIAFGVPLILSQHTAFEENWREYTSLDGVADDFSSSTHEYKAAAAIFSQNPTVERIKIGKKAANIAEVVSITPTAVNEFTYWIEVRGVRYEYTSDATATVSEIIGGFVALLSGVDDLTASDQTSYLRITASTAGLGLSVRIGDNLVLATTTANVGCESALSTISTEDDDFYGIMTVSRTVVDVMACAAWAEARMKFFVTASANADILSAVATSDIAYKLKAKNYDRNAVLYSADEGNYPDAAILGMALPHDPGTITYKFKGLQGIETDLLTETEKTAARNKNCNVYVTVAGINMIEEGVCSSGEYCDVINGLDWITANIQAEVFASLSNEPKIPYTNQGVDAVKVKIFAVLYVAVDRGILRADPKPTVTAPDVADISIANRSNRVLPDIRFTGQLAGAIHKALIRGTVTV